MDENSFLSERGIDASLLPPEIARLLEDRIRVAEEIYIQHARKALDDIFFKTGTGGSGLNELFD